MENSENKCRNHPPMIRKSESLNLNILNSLKSKTKLSKKKEIISYDYLNKVFNGLNIGYVIFNSNMSIINFNKIISSNSKEFEISQNKFNQSLDIDDFILNDINKISDSNSIHKPLLSNEYFCGNVTRKISSINFFEDHKIKNYLENLLNNLIEFNENVIQIDKINSTSSLNSLFSNGMNPLFKFQNLNEFIESINNKNFEEEFITVGVSKLDNKYIEIKVKLSEQKNISGDLIMNHNGRLMLNNNYNCEFILNDISKIREAEIIKSQMKYKSMGLAKVAHEFKNPLFTISTLLKENLEDESFLLNDNLNNKILIQNLCDYLIILIEDFNQYAKFDIEKISKTIPKISLENKISTNSVKLFPILEFCINIFKIRQNYENKENINIELEIEKEVPKFVCVNETKLKQIIVNLISNAFKFTQYGKITLKASVAGTTEENKKIIRISVKDSGIGMTENEQKVLFNPFKMLDSGKGMNMTGSGLGLLIIKEILGKMGSEINIKSEKGKGSEFYFDLIESNSNVFIDNMSNNNFNNICNNTYNNSIQNLTRTFTSSCEENIIDPQIFYTDSFINIIKNMNDNNYSLIQDNPDRILMEDKIILESNSEECSFKLDDQYLNQNYNSDYNSIENNTNINNDNSQNESEIFRKVRRKKSEHDLNKVSKIMNKISNRSLSKFNIKNFKSIRKVRVIICDDEKIVTNSAKKNFEKIFTENKIDYEIDIFHTGIECLYHIFLERKKGKYYDILIIDESMPFMRGSMIVNNLRTLIEENELKEILIYISTSYEDFKGVSNCEIIRKPLTYESIKVILTGNKFIN